MKSKPDLIWRPKYKITDGIARGLMEIEAARTAVAETPLSPAAEAELRRNARVRSTHYSTRIEGNRLTLAEAEKVINVQKTRFHGRERDVREVRNYWNALLRVEKWAEEKKPLNEDLIRRLHSLVLKGRTNPSPYRDGQNVIRDSAGGAIIYLPPEARDVPRLMAGMVQWTRKAEAGGMPAPIIAGLIHYQFVTIHPFYDGNGRTARLLATFILHGRGYGLNGFFSLEEHHARDLEGYYRSLATHPHHNYYEGRATADLTPWLDYFVRTLAAVFGEAREQAKKYAQNKLPAIPDALSRLDRRARAILALFAGQDKITSGEMARALGLSARMARVLARQWVAQGLLAQTGSGNRNRAYILSAIYRQRKGIKAAREIRRIPT